METTKICSKCGRELPLSEFNKCKRNKDGLQPYCKDCRKQYRADNREHILEQKKQYYAEHRDELIEKNKQYYAEHAEARKQYKKQWDAENREYKKQYMKEYNAANAEHKKQYNKQWRAEHRDEQLEYKKQYYSTIEGYARRIRYNNLQEDREHGRCGMNEDILPPLDYYIWAIQQRDFYDGKQYPFNEMGLDRIDNSKPHTIDNIVPCSTAHNVQRQKMPFEEFCELMRKETTSINGKEVS